MGMNNTCALEPVVWLVRLLSGALRLDCCVGAVEAMRRLSRSVAARLQAGAFTCRLGPIVSPPTLPLHTGADCGQDVSFVLPAISLKQVCVCGSKSKWENSIIIADCDKCPPSQHYVPALKAQKMVKLKHHWSCNYKYSNTFNIDHVVTHAQAYFTRFPWKL